MSWECRSHADRWLIFPQNMSAELSIDEVALSGGELYTVVTSKQAKGRKGCLVAIIFGTDSETVIAHLAKIDRSLRYKVEEITLDMSGSMRLIAQKCFPRATQVIDRFHVQQLASEALQEIRIKYRWEAIDQENEQIAKAKAQDKTYVPQTHINGDTTKQLLARSRHLLYKSPDRWTQSQQERAGILFLLYPDIRKAYELTNSLRSIYNRRILKTIAMTKLALWFNQVEASGFKTFNTLLRTIKQHYNDILNYFNQRSTNASAESFNAKIKAFRNQFRGVRDTTFFLFRITKIFS